MAEFAGVSEQSDRDADGCRMPTQPTPDEPDNANTVTDGMLGLSIDSRSQIFTGIAEEGSPNIRTQFTVSSSDIEVGHTPVTTGIPFEPDFRSGYPGCSGEFGIEPRRSVPTVPQPRYSGYREESVRRKTFTEPVDGRSWPHGPDVQEVENLIRIGMFYTGTDDLVRCYHCGLGLKDWSRQDDALYVHYKHTPSCHHILTTIDAKLLRIYQRQIDDENGVIFSPETPARGTLDAMPPGGMHTRQIHEIRHPEYESYEVRLASFTRWPTGISQTPEQLAEAGFFHSGFRDIVRCYACAGVLHNFDVGDDPWIEHARWFEFCSHVLREKGEKYIKLVQAAVDDADEGENELDENTNADVVYPLYSKAGKDVIDMGYSRRAVAMAIEECKYSGITSELILNVLLEKQKKGEKLPEDEPEPETPGVPEFDGHTEQSLLQEREYLQNRLFCAKCRVNKCNVLFIPCQHHKMCESCAKDVTQCFICSETILHRVKTLLS